MATPRRRSSRLRQSPAAQAHNNQPPTKQLATLVEREETPERGAPNNLNVVTSPATAHTPTSTASLKPSAQEMHPTMYHSTIKKKASETHFGFSSKSTVHSDGPVSPGEMSSPIRALPSVPQTAPSNQSKEKRESIASPDYAFTFRHPSTELSSEAQRIMDSVRDEAARIKAQLTLQRQEQMLKDGNADAMFGGRKMAQAKGKLGRFSDVHLDQFKKMDSIADHPSSFRADPSRNSKPSTPTKSLKRTNSKVDLDKAATPQALKRSVSKNQMEKKDAEPQILKRANSKSSIPAPSKASAPKSSIKVVNQSSEGTTPEQGPAKRRKTMFESKAAAAEAPVASAANPSSTEAPPLPTSKIPRSPSTKSLLPPSTPQQSQPAAAPTVPQTAPPARPSRGTFFSKLQPFKSILRKPQIKFSNDPLKQAAGTHFAPPTNVKTPERKEEKHVNFTPEPARVHNISPAHTPGSTPGGGSNKGHEQQGSPSPVKQPVSARLVDEDDHKGSDDWEDMEVDEPAAEEAATPTRSISYPALFPASAPPKATTQPRASPAPERGSKGDFTFTFSPSSKLSFAPAPPKEASASPVTAAIAAAPSPPKRAPSMAKNISQPNSMSPTKAATQKTACQPSFSKSPSTSSFMAPTSASNAKTNDTASPSTIRKVRPSIAPSAIQGPLKTVDHGLANKKRKREFGDVGTKHDDDTEDKENEQREAQSPAKKIRTAAPEVSGIGGSPVKGRTPQTLKSREKRMSTMKSAASRLMSPPGQMSPATRIMSPAAQRVMSASPSPSKGVGSRVGSPGVGSPSPMKKGISWARLEALAMPKKRA